MERSITKFFLLLLTVSALVWIAASGYKNYQVGMLLKFGTVEFKEGIDPDAERTVYRVVSENIIVTAVSYPFVLLAAAGYLRTTRRSFKMDGWLMMSAILLFLFIPVELYCFVLDWKIIGLNYWGEWPIEEFRKAVIHRWTALAGLPLVAQFCYYSIPLLILFKPLKRNAE